MKNVTDLSSHKVKVLYLLTVYCTVLKMSCVLKYARFYVVAVLNWLTVTINMTNTVRIRSHGSDVRWCFGLTTMTQRLPDPFVAD